LLLQGSLQPVVVARCHVVPLDVGQAIQRQPALAGEAVALQLDGDVVLQLVAQREDEGFGG